MKGPTSPIGEAPLSPHHPITSAPLRPRRVIILANPRAGSASSREVVLELVDALRDERLEATVCWRREEFSDVVAGSEREEVRCVVAAGGDGTLVETVNRAAGLPVTILPLGTENLVARYWGIERSGRQVAHTIAAWDPRLLDLGRVTRLAGLDPTGKPPAVGRLFCLMAGVGFDADVVNRLHRKRSGHISLYSYVRPIVQALRRYRFPVMDVMILDTGERLRGAMVFVLNLPRYAMGLPLAPEARGDDGLLNLLVFERPGIFHLFRYLTGILQGRRDKLRDCHHRWVRAVRLEAALTVRVQTDGDPAANLPVTIEVVPRAMTLLVPPGSAP
jgi:diacylglycerol kinase (ATP)